MPPHRAAQMWPLLGCSAGQQLPKERSQELAVGPPAGPIPPPRFGEQGSPQLPSPGRDTGMAYTQDMSRKGVLCQDCAWGAHL